MTTWAPSTGSPVAAFRVTPPREPTVPLGGGVTGSPLQASPAASASRIGRRTVICLGRHCQRLGLRRCPGALAAAERCGDERHGGCRRGAAGQPGSLATRVEEETSSHGWTCLERSSARGSGQRIPSDTPERTIPGGLTATNFTVPACGQAPCTRRTSALLPLVYGQKRCPNIPGAEMRSQRAIGRGSTGNASGLGGNVSQVQRVARRAAAANLQ